MNSATNLLRKLLIGFQPPLRCVGCNRSDFEVAKLVSGPRVYICDVCAREAAARVHTNFADVSKSLVCSFCGGTAHVVPIGPDDNHGTCASCVELIQSVLRETESRM